MNLLSNNAQVSSGIQDITNYNYNHEEEEKEDDYDDNYKVVVVVAEMRSDESCCFELKVSLLLCEPEQILELS